MRNFDFLLLSIIENTLFSPGFVFNVLSKFSIKVVGAGRSRQQWVSICAAFPMSSKSCLCKNRVIICTFTFFGKHDDGDGLVISALKACLWVLLLKQLAFC